MRIVTRVLRAVVKLAWQIVIKTAATLVLLTSPLWYFGCPLLVLMFALQLVFTEVPWWYSVLGMLEGVGLLLLAFTIIALGFPSLGALGGPARVRAPVRRNSAQRPPAAPRPRPEAPRAPPPPPRRPAPESPPREPDAWTVLGVTPGSSPEVIRKAYVARIKEYHPDRVATLGVEIRELAARKAQVINAAYEELRRRS